MIILVRMKGWVPFKDEYFTFYRYPKSKLVLAIFFAKMADSAFRFGDTP